MNRRCIVSAFAMVVLAAGLSAQSLKIAVMDFTLESDNPQFKYLGKGFTELVSVEVARLPGFVLVDRARRNAILEEQEFALSGVADESGAMEIGQLLSVDYFVVGSIIDMMGNLLVSYSIIRTESGAVVGMRTTDGVPTDYKRIVKDIGVGIATMAGKEGAIAVAKAAPPPPAPVAKQAEVLTGFSDAVAALDAKDVKTATAKLEAARKLDPTDPAVRFYLDKLAAGTSKFAVIPEVYFSLNNPASLALRDSATSYFYIAFGGTYLTGTDWPGLEASVFPAAVELSGDYGADAPGAAYATKYGVREIDSRIFSGYGTPIGSNMGLGAQAFFSHVEANVQRKADTGGSPEDPLYVAGWDSLSFYGGELMLSWAPAPGFSLGIGGTVGGYGGSVRDWQTANDDTETNPQELFYGGEFGLMLKSPRGDLLGALSLGASSYLRNEFDMDDITLGGAKVDMNGFLDLSVTLGLNQMRDFVVLKFIQNIYGFSGMMAPFLQLLPAYEHWFGSALSVRVGGVLSMSPKETLYVGYGGTAGATLVLGTWEIDIGATYRNRPSRIYSSEIIPETIFSVGLRKNATARKTN